MSFNFRAGSAPLLISIPHNGFEIPPAIAQTMTAAGRTSRDTDWFLARLYDFPELDDASRIVSQFSRYVIDLNRPSDNASLYPGQTSTGLIPDSRFDGAAVYENGLPDKAEIRRRIEEIWLPYHQQIRIELDRLLGRHGVVVLIEAHSIASVVPRLFPGVLPDFNIGTNRGLSCASTLSNVIVEVLRRQHKYSHVFNGRFVGGYITRHFGEPSRQIHAVQIELSQATYMDETTLTWDDNKAITVQPVFRKIISAIKQWIRNQ